MDKIEKNKTRYLLIPIPQKPKKIKRIYKEHNNTESAFDPYDYLGKVKAVWGDGLEFQKTIRDEWER